MATEDAHDPNSQSPNSGHGLEGTRHGIHADTLKRLVHLSSINHDVMQGIHSRSTVLEKVHWPKWLEAALEKMAAKRHWGNFVAVRGQDTKVFESMPLYARTGMHLLFYGKEELELVHLRRIERLFMEESIKQGKIYDSPESVHAIPSFVKSYSIQLDELLNPDIHSYKTFNEFFSRQLKADARPVEKPDDGSNFCCCADARLTVFDTVDLAKELWIKGKNFTIPNLINVASDSEKGTLFANGCVAVFRLAPQDYHRFHCPLDGVVMDITHISGQYYTVNPMAVNEPGFDVFTENVRSVLYLKHSKTGKLVAFVAIGALLVGSIKWTAGGEKGKVVKRGDELGYFAYGGSTVVVIFPEGMIEFDADLLKNSRSPIETLVRVGNSLGQLRSSS